MAKAKKIVRRELDQSRREAIKDNGEGESRSY